MYSKNIKHFKKFKSVNEKIDYICETFNNTTVTIVY